MSKKKTKEEWQLESDKIHSNEFEILDNPNSGVEILRVFHKKCGNILNTSLHNHVKRYCTYCSNKKKKTKEDWQISSDKIHNNEFTLLDDVKNGKQKISLLHKKCGNIIYMTMNNHINHKNGCKKCSKNSLKDNEFWIRKIKEIWGEEYKISEVITNVHQKVNIIHNTCGKVHIKNMNSFLHGKRGCPYCNQNFAKTKEYWQQKMNTFHGDGKYEILDSPKNMRSKIKIRHNVCNRIYMTTPGVIKFGCGCNICSMSKGNIKITNFLEKENIKFETEKSFKNCYLNKRLRFDFYLPEFNTCIEYDGIQHFESVEIFGGEKQFLENKKRDEIKNSFCEENDIPLIRIDYLNFYKIEEILWQQLLKNKHQQA